MTCFLFAADEVRNILASAGDSVAFDVVARVFEQVDEVNNSGLLGLRWFHSDIEEVYELCIAIVRHVLCFCDCWGLFSD